MKNRIGELCIVIVGMLILSGCSSPVSSPKGTPITLEGIAADGNSGTETTDTLTLTFSADLSTLTKDYITVKGATKGDLTGSGVTRTLSISEITSKNGEKVTVTISNPPGFRISGASQEVTINVKDGERVFWARKVKSGDKSWYKVPATRKGSTSHCEVYVADASLTGARAVSAATAQAIATKFESSIHTPIQNKFDVVSDVDKDGKITLLLLDIVDDYDSENNQHAFVGGYFDGTHLVSSAAYPNSNLTDMLFVDTDPQDPGSNGFYQTLAHEFQHLINFNHNYIQGGRRQADTWINEGLSTAAEYFYNNGHVQSRISYYNSTQYNNAIKNGAYFFNWQPSWTTDKVASYATVYLFFQWLRIQASNGDGIYKSIYAERNMNLASFLRAVTPQGVGTTWRDILGKWFTANLFNNASGLYGYKGEITLNAPARSVSATRKFDLFPGEAVYIQKTATDEFSPTAQGNIAHIGLNTTSKQIDEATPFEGDYHLVYNYNDNKSGSKVAAQIPTGSVSPSLSASHSHIPSSSFSTPQSTEIWPIDIVFDPSGPSGATGESADSASQTKAQH